MSDVTVKPELAPNGHLQVTGDRGSRRWRAFWWDADGKHSRGVGEAWVQSSGRRTSRGAIVWHSADGSKPDSSYLTPEEAELELRRLLEHDAAKSPTPRAAAPGSIVTFADAAEAWYRSWRAQAQPEALDACVTIVRSSTVPASAHQRTGRGVRRYGAWRGQPIQARIVRDHASAEDHRAAVKALVRRAALRRTQRSC